MVDSYGRRINYLRISLTDRCNLRCIYCMPQEGIVKKRHEDIIRYEDVLKIIKAASKIGIDKIRFTGGEPLILKDIDKLIYYTSRIDSIRDISITTNGILLSDMIDDLKNAGLKRVNISLDTLNEDKFDEITRGGDLKKVLKGIEKCLSLGIKPIKINTVMMRGINSDELLDLMELTREIPISVRFIELMPIGEGERLYKKRFISSNEVISSYELIPMEGDKSTAALYRFKDSLGSIGFISPMSHKFCNSCNRIRITSDGTIKPCLHSEKEISLKEYLGDEKLLLNKIKDAIYNKPREHHLVEDEKSNSKKMMFQIGG